MTSRLALLAVAAGALLLAPRAAGADRVYWSVAGSPGGGGIAYANLDGSGTATQLSTTGASPLGDAAGLAVDSATGRIYWGNDASVPAASTISFANLDGSGGGGDLSTTGATQPITPMGLGIDPVGRRLYWAVAGTPGRISMASLDGTGGGDLPTAGATTSFPAGVAVDPTTRRIYWANNAPPTKISWARLDGSGGGDLNTSGATVSSPIGVALDPVTGRIYWANRTTISWANLDGSGGGDLSTPGVTVSHPSGVAIDPVRRRIYWAGATLGPAGGEISFANLDGSGGGQLAATHVDDPAYPNFLLLLEAPAAAGAPAVSGGTTPGSPLSCSPGDWAPDLPGSSMYRAPQRLVYQWTRDGTAIAGATAASYTASMPGDYRCTVTASNAAGSSTQTSSAHTIAPPPPTARPPRPRITRLRESRKRFRAGRGTRFTFFLNEPATVTVTIVRTATHRRAAKLTVHRRAGRNTLRFRARGLKPGRYRASFTARNANGKSAAKRLSFTVVRRR